MPRDRTRFPLAVGALLLAAGACSDWPGLNAKQRAGNNTVAASSQGTCSGTPLACAALTGADCSAAAGCVDRGTCGGTPTQVGTSCTAQSSAQGCSATTGCVWAGSCSGTQFGTCSAFTDVACVGTKGCTWTSTTGSGGTTSTGTGTGGGTAACTTFGSSCTTASTCDCGLQCVIQCVGCSGSCGRPCTSAAECTGATGSFGVSTPRCVRALTNPGAPYTGVCSQ